VSSINSEERLCGNGVYWPHHVRTRRVPSTENTPQIAVEDCNFRNSEATPLLLASNFCVLRKFAERIGVCIPISALKYWGLKRGEMESVYNYTMKSKSCYDSRSVSVSWCRFHSGTCDQILFSFWKLLCCLCGEPSLTRGRAYLLSATVSSI
jgi:hypothetical protein